MPKNSRTLKRQFFEIQNTDNGYAINPPVHRGLVLSGGGAKGIAYSGMIRAMHERGFLKNLTHISGSSAGAMTASLLAIGMSHENITKLINQLNMIYCLDNKGWRIRAVGERVRNVLEIIYLYQIKEHMTGLEQPQTDEGIFNFNAINQKIRMYESILQKQGIQINSLEDILTVGQSIEELDKLDAAFKELPKDITDLDGKKIESPRITFSDLSRLRSILPEDKQHLIKNLTVTTTNQTRNKMEYYGEDHSLGESIAEKVQISGAHPMLFTPKLNEHGEYIADGGILDNMPTLPLEQAGLEREEIVCVSIETGTQFEARIALAKKHTLEDVHGIYYGMDWVGEQVFGGKILEGDATVYNREKIFHYIGNMLFLNAGTITTTTINPTSEQKQTADKNGYNQTNELLDSHKKTFSNPLIAMLYLGKDNLAALMESDIEDKELLKSAALAQSIFHLQQILAEELDDEKYSDVEYYIKQIENILTLDADLNEIEQKQAMALCLKQVDFFTEGALEKYIVNRIQTEEDANKVSWFTELLNLIRAAIDWVLTTFSCAEPEDCEEEVIEVEEVTIQDEKPISAYRLYGLFHYINDNVPKTKNESEETPDLNTEPSLV